MMEGNDDGKKSVIGEQIYAKTCDTLNREEVEPPAPSTAARAFSTGLRE
jgi:hypothetical protein